jgi:hypothetical protein
VLGLPWWQAVLLGRQGPRLGQVEAQLRRQRILLQVQVSWCCTLICAFIVGRDVLQICRMVGASGGAIVGAADSATSPGKVWAEVDLVDSSQAVSALTHNMRAAACDADINL